MTHGFHDEFMHCFNLRKTYKKKNSDKNFKDKETNVQCFSGKLKVITKEILTGTILLLRTMIFTVC